MVTRKVDFKVTAIIVFLAIGITRTEDEITILTKNVIKQSELSKEVRLKRNTEESLYPAVWAKVDLKPVIDNERLYQKYKKCILTNDKKGCPSLVMQAKKVIPEAVETMCAKCSPELIERIKETVEYVCLKRRSDYDQVVMEKDPGNKVRNAFRAKYGDVNC